MCGFDTAIQTICRLFKGVRVTVTLPRLTSEFRVLGTIKVRTPLVPRSPDADQTLRVMALILLGLCTEEVVLLGWLLPLETGQFTFAHDLVNVLLVRQWS